MLFDPVRSADPPIVNGIFLLITAKVNSDDFLVAIVGLSSIIVFLNLLNLLYQNHLFVDKVYSSHSSGNFSLSLSSS